MGTFSLKKKTSFSDFPGQYFVLLMMMRITMPARSLRLRSTSLKTLLLRSRSRHAYVRIRTKKIENDRLSIDSDGKYGNYDDDNEAHQWMIFLVLLATVLLW